MVELDVKENLSEELDRYSQLDEKGLKEEVSKKLRGLDEEGTLNYVQELIKMVQAEQSKRLYYQHRKY